MKRTVKLIAMALLVFLAGCGYHIAGKGGQMPGGIKELYIPLFQNETPKPDIESILTSAFINEFVNTVQVTDQAGARMQGLIKSYILTPISYSTNDVNQEYRLTVIMGLKITDPDGKIIWEDEGVTDYEDFRVNISDVSATREAEEQALRKLARDTARLVKERMLEDF